MLIICDTTHNIIIWINKQKTAFERLPPIIHALVSKGYSQDAKV